MTYGLAKRVTLGAGLILGLLGGGCDRWAAGARNETHEANYIEGTNFRFQGQTNRAIQSFERALHVNPSNVQAHMAIADLFYGTEDFTSAAYHYRRCKRLQEERGVKPDQTLLGLIESCDLQLAVRFSDRLMRQQTDAQLDELRQKLAERNDTILKLQQEIRRLQSLAQVASTPVQSPPQVAVERPQPDPVQTPPPASRSAAPEVTSRPATRTPVATPAPSARTTPTPTPTPPTSSSASSTTTRAKPATRLRSYTVRRGDTPASIARRAGISLKSLMAANPNLHPTRMRPGQILQVPAP